MKWQTANHFSVVLKNSLNGGVVHAMVLSNESSLSFFGEPKYNQVKLELSVLK
jgi:hypothetical protein